MNSKLNQMSISEDDEFVIIDLIKQNKFKMNNQSNLISISFQKFIDLIRLEQEGLKFEIKKLKEQNAFILNEIKIENDIVIKKLDDFMQIKKLNDLKIYQNLPIPKLNKKMNINNWFKIYRKVMNTTNNRILVSCLGYYLSDEMAILLTKIKDYDYLDEIEDQLCKKLEIEMYLN